MAATEISIDRSGDGWVGTRVADRNYTVVRHGNIKFDLGDQRPGMNESAWGPEATANILARSAPNSSDRRTK